MTPFNMREEKRRLKVHRPYSGEMGHEIRQVAPGAKLCDMPYVTASVIYLLVHR